MKEEKKKQAKITRSVKGRKRKSSRVEVIIRLKEARKM